MLTGYQVHTAANVVLAERGRKAIKPQLVYNYIKQGRIAIVRASDGTDVRYEDLADGEKYLVTQSEAVRWIREFSENPESTGSSSAVANLLAELQGE